MLRRDIAAELSSRERCPQVRGERRPLANGERSGLRPRMSRHRRAIAGGEYVWMRRRLQPFVHRDEAGGIQREPCFAKPWHGRGAGCPDRRVGRDASARRVNPVSLDLTAGLARCASIPRAAQMRLKICCARSLWVGSSSRSSVIRWQSIASPRPASRLRRYCMASNVSTPAAPPPTTASRRNAPVRARSMSPLHARRNRSTGLTSMLCSAAPAMFAFPGAEPMSMDARSNSIRAPLDQRGDLSRRVERADQGLVKMRLGSRDRFARSMCASSDR